MSGQPTDSGGSTDPDTAATDESDGGVNVNIEQNDSSPSVIVRGIYFLFVGWWASAIWLGIAWLLNVTVILMPFGIKMINMTPKIVSLKNRKLDTDVETDAEGNVTVSEETAEQYSLVVRAVYFLLVGWWASGLWMSIAWVFSVTVVGLPIAVMMYDRLPFVVSLYKY